MNYFCRQEKTFGLGNFINCTPTIRALSEYYKEPFPVLFETDYLKDLYSGVDFIKIITQQHGRELFGSYDTASTEPDWQYIRRKVSMELAIPLNEFRTFVPAKKIDLGYKFVVLLRGCFSNIPYKVKAKDPGDDVYIPIIADLVEKEYKVIFVGTDDDKARAEKMLKHFYRYVLTWETSIHEAVNLVNSCEFVVCNDTGLYHAAASLDKKVFCMWEKTNRIKNMACGDTVTYSNSNHIQNFKQWIGA